MSDNWVVQHLINTLDTWNEKMGEVWSLLTMSPASFKGGGIWRTILAINGSLQAIGLALMVLFFLAGVVKTSANLGEIKRPEHALKLFIRFAIAKGVATYGLELMMSIFSIAQGVMSKIMALAGVSKTSKVTLTEAALWNADEAEFGNKAVSNAVGVLATENEDVRSLRELITYGLKGLRRVTGGASGRHKDKRSCFDTHKIPPAI